ncbi:MAG: extracellular solute-binding protein [Chloroflexota bacterium]
MSSGKLTRVCTATFLALLLIVGTLPARAAPARSSVTISVWTAYTKGLLDAFNTLTTRFQQKYPNIQVQEVSSANYTALQQKEQSAIFAHNTPTMGQAYENWVQQYVQNNAIQNLTPYIKGKNGFSRSSIKDFFAGDWKDAYLGGKPLMMPFSKSDIVLYFDGPMLHRFGVKHPPHTWSQFAADCKKVTKFSGGRAKTWCLTLQVPESEWYAWEYEWGAKVLNKNHRAAFNTKTGIAPVAFFRNLVKKGEMVISQTANYQDEADFDAGKAAFDVGTSAGLTYEIAGAVKGVGVGETAFPSGPKGRVTELYGAPLTIFKSASGPEKQAAWDFVKWLTEPAQTAYWAEHTGYMPVRKSALKLMTKYYRANPQQRASVAEQDNAVVEPPLAGWSKAQTDLNTILLGALTGSTSPSSAMKRAAQQVNSDLSS